MLAVVFIWVVIAVVTIGLGLFVTDRLGISGGTEPVTFLIINSLTGLSALIPLLAICSLGIRLNIELLMVFLVFGIGSILLQRKRVVIEVWSHTKFNWIKFISITLLPVALVLYYAVLNPGSIGDTLLYHAQCIQWSENYKAIPGLAHIHNRLAFNNHSLLPFALFGFSCSDIQTFYCVNSYLFLMLVLYCCIKVIINLDQQHGAKDLLFYASILGSAFFMIGDRIASPAPDNTAAIYVIFCVMLFKEILRDDKRELLPTLYLCAFLLPTIKVSTVFIALLPVLISLSYGYHKLIRHWFLVVAIGIFTVFPFFARNMILSGYLIFPFPLDVFNFDWQYFDTGRLVMMNKYIINAARITGPHDPGLWTYDMSIFEWFPHWISWRSSVYYFMNLLLPFCLIFNVIYLVTWVRSRSKADLLYLFFSVFFFISFLYWLFSAPDFRFIWGTMISGLGIIVYYMLDKRPVAKAPMNFIIIIGLFISFVGFGITDIKLKVVRKHLIKPMSLKEVKVTPEKYGPIVVNIPSSKKLGGLCHNAPIPCTHKIHDSFEARGGKLTDGFRSNPALKKAKQKKGKKTN